MPTISTANGSRLGVASPPIMPTHGVGNGSSGDLGCWIDGR
ncbi:MULTISPECIES: hypothetical protein [unclassified Moraxella]|nr:MULTISPECIES: hypothetical protein [unclassified Moraxella]